MTAAHEAVLKAVRQVSMLMPLVADCDRRALLTARQDELRDCRNALKVYFASLKSKLLNAQIDHLSNDWDKADKNAKKIEQQLSQKRSEETQLKQNIAENGGDRIERLAVEIRNHEAESVKRKNKFERFSELAKILNVSVPKDVSAFHQQKAIFLTQVEKIADLESDLENKNTELSVAFQNGKTEHDELSKEIKSLESRVSNIPLEQIKLREALCSELNISQSDVLFAGEVLAIREDEKEWEGAVERLLRNFGLSLLVPDKFYSVVADWVDRTHLKKRMVYFRVRSDVRDDNLHLERDSLARKIAVKPDSLFYDWLKKEVAHRFDLVSCTSQEQFRREKRAITISGQIKAPGERHEKDDRYAIDDRRRFVLGWSNAAKLKALKQGLAQLEKRMQSLGTQLSEISVKRKELKAEYDALTKLAEYRDFAEIDWHSEVALIAKLQVEKQHLESTSDILKELSQTLKAVQEDLALLEEKLRTELDRRSRLSQKKSDAEDLQVSLKAMLDDPDNAIHFDRFELLSQLQAEILGQTQVTLENSSFKEEEMRSSLQRRIDSDEQKINRLNEKIVSAMTKYKSDYPVETRDIDSSVDAASEYSKMLSALNADDLPRFQARFKELLNENTIREIANFNSQLARERETIKERIALINKSLTNIDYNKDRYIVLQAHLSQDIDIRDFQTELRACTEGAIIGSSESQYSEIKFLQVKSIIERFSGREGSIDQDKRWTTRVTDVRNWFGFAALGETLPESQVKGTVGVAPLPRQIH